MTVGRMINRATVTVPGLAFLAWVVVAAACERRAQVPPGFQGTVEYDDRVLAFEGPGRVVWVGAQRGDLVDAGQVLAKLDDQLASLTVEARRHEAAAARAALALLQAGTRHQDVEAAAADLVAADASEAFLRKSAERAHALLKSGSSDQSDVDKADSDLERAVAQRRSLAAHLESLRNGARSQELLKAQAEADQAASELALEAVRLTRYQLLIDRRRRDPRRPREARRARRGGHRRRDRGRHRPPLCRRLRARGGALRPAPGEQGPGAGGR